MGRLMLIFGMIFLLLFPISSVAEEDVNKNDDPTNKFEELLLEDSEPFITLPPGTPVKLVLFEQIYSQRNREGDEIIFAIKKDVVIMGRTYLYAGTPVIGRVTKVKPAKSWGREGTLDVEISSILPLYSMPIALTSDLESAGKPRRAEAVERDGFFPFVLLGGLLEGATTSGSGAKIEIGTCITVFTAQEGKIKSLPEEETNALIIQWYEEKIVTSFLDYTWDNNKPVKDAISSLGFTVDESSITFELLEDFFCTVSIQLSPTQVADFVFRPFEEPHIGKFKSIEGRNELAKEIIRAVED